MIVVLTGGTGGAKFVDGLRQVVSARELTIIVNTGDDLAWWGLHVCPDLDSITYVMAGPPPKKSGWGGKGGTVFFMQAMGGVGQPAWFPLRAPALAFPLLRPPFLSPGENPPQA